MVFLHSKYVEVEGRVDNIRAAVWWGAGFKFQAAARSEEDRRAPSCLHPLSSIIIIPIITITGCITIINIIRISLSIIIITIPILFIVTELLIVFISLLITVLLGVNFCFGELAKVQSYHKI